MGREGRVLPQSAEPREGNDVSLNRRQILAGGLGLGAAVGLSACSGLTSKAGSSAPTGSASAGAPVELTFVNWSGDAEKAAFDAVIASFEQANPGITIKTDTVPYASVQTNLDTRLDRKSTRLNSSHSGESRMPSSA